MVTVENFIQINQLLHSPLLSSLLLVTMILLVLCESNITAGKQTFTPGVTFKGQLTYGQSITDSCIDIPMTDELLQNLAQGVQARRELNKLSSDDKGGADTSGVVSTKQ